MHVFLSLESSSGDLEMNLVTARDLLMKHDVLVLGQSNVFEENGAHQVVECGTELVLADLILVCRIVEKEMGSSVEIPVGNVKFGAPVPGSAGLISIGVIFYGDQAFEAPSFAWEGVLELSPDFVHPVLKKPLKALLAQA
ncbi:MAG: hypothetical protein WC777_02745 [Candidatus Gracilibacteria bacterium]|jgi:7,8-dihydro-6-hydroxymethylpterin-pyrophosphokinase